MDCKHLVTCGLCSPFQPPKWENSLHVPQRGANLCSAVLRETYRLHVFLSVILCSLGWLGARWVKLEDALSCSHCLRRQKLLPQLARMMVSVSACKLPYLAPKKSSSGSPMVVVLWAEPKPLKKACFVFIVGLQLFSKLPPAQWPLSPQTTLCCVCDPLFLKGGIFNL